LDQKDVVIIGGGPGGYVAAIHAAHLGAEVALIEKDRLGGTCLNHGCIPTKALVRSAEILLEAKRADEFGVEIGSVKADLPRIMERKRKVVDTLVSGVEQLIKANKVSLHRGIGRLASPCLVKVNTTEIAARKIIIATGSESALLPIDGLDLPGVLTTDDILELEEIPESLVVIGGSHVGVEFASIFSALGTPPAVGAYRPRDWATLCSIAAEAGHPCDNRSCRQGNRKRQIASQSSLGYR
jgi:dihydrolipoamide dehydrogenase